MIKKPLSLKTYIEILQERGNLFLSKEQVIQDLHLPKQSVDLAFSKLAQKKRLFRLRKGFYVIVPQEYKEEGHPPPHWFIDSMMGYTQDAYYVALLSAASFYESAPSPTLPFQVITNNLHLRELKTRQMAIHFYRKKTFPPQGITHIETATGLMKVSTPELTAFDLVKYPKASETLHNITTVLSKLAEKIEGSKLASLAENTILERRENVYWQRVGYLLDLAGYPHKTDALKQWLGQQNASYSYLVHSNKKSSFERCDKWRLYINEKVKIIM